MTDDEPTVDDLKDEVDGVLIAGPVECSECGSPVYVDPEFFETDDDLTCDDHN